jgi:hypothetical protein
LSLVIKNRPLPFSNDRGITWFCAQISTSLCYVTVREEKLEGARGDQDALRAIPSPPSPNLGRPPTCVIRNGPRSSQKFCDERNTVSPFMIPSKRTKICYLIMAPKYKKSWLQQEQCTIILDDWVEPRKATVKMGLNRLSPEYMSYVLS